MQTQLNQPPVRPARPGLASPAPAVRDYRVNYTVNGMRAAWSLGARSRAHAIESMKELVPGCTINLVSIEGEW